jgi:hypothetical protein
VLTPTLWESGNAIAVDALMPIERARYRVTTSFNLFGLHRTAKSLRPCSSRPSTGKVSKDSPDALIRIGLRARSSLKTRLSDTLLVAKQS